MPRATVNDTSLTRSYIPKVSQTPGISPTIAHFYKLIENRCIHEGRVVDQLYYTSDHIDRCFSNIRLNCLYEINEPIDLSSLANSQETEGPYHTDLPTPEEIHQFVQFQRVDPHRTIKHKNDILSPNQVQTKELRQDLKRWNELIYENVFGLGGHQDHLPACLAHIFYCILAEQQYNLAYFFVKRIKSARATPKAHLPYETRSDHEKSRHSVSSTSAHHNRGSSSHQDDDDKDDGASRAITPSPTTYLNSLGPLDYQQYDVPTSSEQNDDLLFERQTDLPNQTQQMHKELRCGFKSFGKALRGVFGKKRNEDVEG
ncbi:hypothetical protein Tco_1342978 [Tanacetum coccineum]